MPQTPTLKSGQDVTGLMSGADVTDLMNAAPSQPPAAPQPAQQPSFLDRAISGFLNIAAPGAGDSQTAVDVVKGVGKSAIGAVEGAGTILRKVPVVGPMLDRGPSIAVNAQPSNTAQSVGKFAGNAALFALPAATVSKVKTALTTGSGILDALVSAGLDAGSAAAVQSAEKGTTQGAGTTAAVAGGMSLAAPVVNKAAGWLGERIEKALIKPQKADLADGFNVANVQKYGLGGTLRQTYDKTEAALRDRTQALQSVLQASGQAGARVDVLDALAATEKELRTAAEASKNSLTYEEIKKASDQLLEKVLPSIQGAGGDPAVDLVKANKIKQLVGDIGAWTHSLGGQVQMGQDANALEEAANAFYGQLKTRIEQQAAGPVKALNQQMSDIIGIRRAVIRRIPVAERANILKIGDLAAAVKGGPSGIALGIANRLLQSGRVASGLMNVGASETPGLWTVPLAGVAASKATGGGSQ